MDCKLCLRLNSKETNTRYIGELKQSSWFVGDHQYYPGYTLLVARDHYKEMIHMPKQPQMELFEDLILAQSIIEKLLRPWKLNVCSLGNRDPHVHWHIFPRFETDDNRLYPTWIKMNEFDTQPGSTEEIQTLVHNIRRELALNKF